MYTRVVSLWLQGVQIISDGPMPGTLTCGMHCPQDLIDAIDHYQKIGTTHVGVNIAFRIS